MRKFNSPVNLKVAADSFVSEAFIDVTLKELVSAHSHCKGHKFETIHYEALP